MRGSTVGRRTSGLRKGTIPPTKSPRPAARSPRPAAHGSAAAPGAPVAPRGGAGAWGLAEAGQARAGFDLRRLRYFGGLLVDGFGAAGAADLPSRAVRSERVDLGIGFPELDAVALWTARNEDGAISIPFIEFILGQFTSSLETFLGDLGDEGARAELHDLLLALGLALKEVDRGGGAVAALPRLGDNFVPEPFLIRLCGPEGLIERTLRRCEALLAEGR